MADVTTSARSTDTVLRIVRYVDRLLQISELGPVPSPLPPPPTVTVTDWGQPYYSQINYIIFTDSLPIEGTLQVFKSSWLNYWLPEVLLDSSAYQVLPEEDAGRSYLAIVIGQVYRGDQFRITYSALGESPYL